ncbi:MAG: response regulator [Treponema sp.]|jgi:signal transduction histidine kinase/CheY-like chemotaxis protein|nr:response regulator [Treponema sp.]
MLRLFRIKTRLIITFFIMALFALIIGLTGFVRLTSIANSAVKTVHNVTILNYIYDYSTAIDSGVYSMVFTSDITISRVVVQTTINNMEKLLEHLNEYLKYQNQFNDIFTPGEMQMMANLLEIFQEVYAPVLYEIFELVGQGRRDEALSMYVNRFSPIYDTFMYYLNMSFIKNLEYSEAKTARNNESASLSANIMLAVVLISLIASVMLALAVTKSIAKPLSEVETAAEKIANGEIDERSYSSTFNDFKSNDEISHLSRRLKDTLLQMTQVQRLKLDAAEARHEKEKAQALARSKGDFLARMSHEIRTPMNAVTGMAELALREDLPDAAREHILTIKQAGVNLLSIINDILDFSKIESGKLEIIPQDYLFSSLINDVVNIIRTKVVGSDIQFVTNIDCNIPNALTGDETRVRQVFLNILSNAVKYTEKGFVSLTVTGEINGDTVNLKIKTADSGKGIKREDIEKLFGDFVQLDLTGNRGIEGTGLGLAITRSLVKAMNGSISVNSEYGSGSVFTVTLPQRIRSHGKISFVEKPASKSVLLYEQREICSDSILSALENLGVNCALVTNDSQFREKAESQTWPFVFVSSSLLDNVARVLSQNKSDSKIVALANFGEVFANKDLCTLTMPAHSISVANALNGVTAGSTFNIDDKSKTRFTARDARVLVVDDISTNLKVTEGLLEPYKMRVDLCKSGMEAIEAVKRANYDLVFMDHMMPEMDGIEAAAAIRVWEKKRAEKDGVSNASRAQIPIVALTANAVVGMREMFIEKGFNDFLTKPMDISKLDEVLERWIPEEKKEKGSKESGNRSQESHSPILAIPGVDTAKGIVMTGGKEAGYRAVLSMFRKDAEDRLPLLQTTPGEDALPSFVTQVHALKSASASIGAAEISARAAALEAAGKSGDMAFIRQNLPAFARQLAELAENINFFLSAAAGDAGTNQGICAPVLRELAAALKSHNASEIDRVLEIINEKPLDSKTKELVEKISDDVLMTEFDRALKTIEDILAE